jgi:hypothetical protein
VGEDVTAPASECASERGTSAPVDDVGGDDTEVETDGHFQENIDFIDLGLVLGSGDVELADGLDVFLAGAFSDAQVRGLASDGTDSTGLEAEFVESAIFWSGFSEPVGGECVLR